MYYLVVTKTHIKNNMITYKYKKDLECLLSLKPVNSLLVLESSKN